MRKKVLFLSSLPPPYYGASVMSKACLEILKNSREFEIRAIKLNYSKEISDIGHLNMSKIKGFLTVRKKINENMKIFKPNLIYFAPATDNLGLLRDYLFIRQIRKENIPIIFHIHSRMFNRKLNNHFYKKMFGGGKAIVLGKELVSDIIPFISEKDIFVLPNAIKNEISDKEFNKIMETRNEKKTFDILFLSNMEESKGWFKALQACKILRDRRIRFNCNFVGAWPSNKERTKFSDYIKKHNLEGQINYLGKKEGIEKKTIIKNSDVLVFPTEYRLETFGVVIIEAMMLGIPAIANSIATIPSTVSDKKTGFLLKENTPQEIAERIELLIKNKPLMLKMGQNGRESFLKRYELKNYKKKFIKIIGSV